MSRPMIAFVDNEMLEKIYEKRKREDGKVKCGIDSYDEEVYSDEDCIMQIIERQEQLMEDIQNFKQFILPSYEL